MIIGFLKLFLITTYVKYIDNIVDISIPIITIKLIVIILPYLLLVFCSK